MFLLSCLCGVITDQPARFPPVPSWLELGWSWSWGLCRTGAGLEIELKLNLEELGMCIGAGAGARLKLGWSWAWAGLELELPGCIPGSPAASSPRPGHVGLPTSAHLCPPLPRASLEVPAQKPGP